jgi:hypothetical protein
MSRPIYKILAEKLDRIYKKDVSDRIVLKWTKFDWLMIGSSAVLLEKQHKLQNNADIFGGFQTRELIFRAILMLHLVKQAACRRRKQI